MKLDPAKLVWTRPPKSFALTPDTVTITTEPGTDLWQRTYYGFRNDNAPLAQLSTREEFFFLHGENRILLRSAPVRPVRCGPLPGQRELAEGLH